MEKNHNTFTKNIIENPFSLMVSHKDFVDHAQRAVHFIATGLNWRSITSGLDYKVNSEQKKPKILLLGPQKKSGMLPIVGRISCRDINAVEQRKTGLTATKTVVTMSNLHTEKSPDNDCFHGTI
ncbi:hypothetical protein [Erwinia psidii]|uniref:Uncharacterized protein n=1 Tax=Erwinia psidii TaxID=69224 RepID=A0A3N6S9E8_9GAMM|nr:hypothetical protein [Erwinia psidii]MCX8958749.1 hypothetical protein [Erwinia psidii]MCX8963029.1 hypothetical protein [Erwinia psidii]MCX8965898.1 hypothetical protein [Erwinia psidii]RQM36603.1 hypothetical protein EB241_19455 [Erwinia psidii]